MSKHFSKIEILGVSVALFPKRCETWLEMALMPSHDVSVVHVGIWITKKASVESSCVSLGTDLNGFF